MANGKKAALALEDGSFFEGLSFGAEGEKTGELVFNTAMTGYQEIITDPSYRGQMVLFTYPLIGNYGVNAEDSEAAGFFSEAVIAREYSRAPGGARREGSLSDVLKENGVPAVEGVDTREITLKIRKSGSMKAVVSTSCLDRKKLAGKARKAPGISGRDLVREVTCREKYVFNSGGRRKIAVLDCGVKLNTLRELSLRDCEVTVHPADAEAGKILREKPAGILISNGPGDPEALPYIVETVKELLGKAPVFGICLGHQLICLALGGRTEKLKFGHHGANHPVRDMKTGKILITSQNHNFCVPEDAFPKKAEPAYINLYDGTVEGLRHRSLPVFSVQFHPEAGPGPNDAKHIFDRFIDLCGGRGAKT